MKSLTSEVRYDEVARFSRDGLISALKLLEECTLINATTQALTQIIFERRETASCKDLFPENLAATICQDPIIRPTFYQGVLIWVMAYYQNFQPPLIPKFFARVTLAQRLGFGSNFSALIDLMEKSKLRVYLNEIEQDFMDIFGCKTKPCDKSFLARKQFLTGSVSNSSKTKYSSLNYSSIANMPGNPKRFDNKIPEIYSFFRIHFNHTDRIFGGESEKLLGYYRGNST